MAKLWYYMQNGRQCGPVSFALLKELAATGHLERSDQIRPEESNRWKSAGKLEKLFPPDEANSLADTENVADDEQAFSDSDAEETVVEPESIAPDPEPPDAPSDLADAIPIQSVETVETPLPEPDPSPAIPETIDEPESQARPAPPVFNLPSANVPPPPTFSPPLSPPSTPKEQTFILPPRTFPSEPVTPETPPPKADPPRKQPEYSSRDRHFEDSVVSDPAKGTEKSVKKSKNGCGCFLFILIHVLVGYVLFDLGCYYDYIQPTGQLSGWRGFIMPTVEMMRDGHPQLRCANRMKQLGIGLHFYHDTNANSFPPAYTIRKDRSGRKVPMHSWRVYLLPFVEYPALYEQIRLDEPWDSPWNRQFHDYDIPAFRCPSHKDYPPGACSYSVIVGGQAFFNEDEYKGFHHLRDGLSNTIAIVERKVPLRTWMDPTQELTWQQIESDMSVLGANHFDNSANIMLFDGAVRSCKMPVSWETLKLYINPNDGRGNPPLE